MKLARRRRRPPVEALDHEALAEILRELEDAHHDATGERLTSAEFYDLYRAGEADGIVDAIRWASYYELYREQGRQALGRKRVRKDSLVTA
ncbi:MAG TPA: hypothetical protein VFA56_03655 [Gaiellaceae bacterium]|nr:hypothetical protein [Gaiellaceae bacterium]